MRQLTITDAAKALGVSRRTVQRQLANGQLSGQKVAGVWLVNVADHTTEPRTAYDDGTVTVLRAQVASLSQQVDSLSHDKDYLQQALAVALSRIPQLPEHATSTQPPRRWWQVWR